MPIRISTSDQAVTFPELISTNKLVVDYFRRLPDTAREAAYERALAIGVMALREDRIAAFLASTQNELGTQLEALKVLMDSNQLRHKSAQLKGDAGEVAVADALIAFTEGRNLPDSVQLIGRTTGRLPRNKTGDILCTVTGEEDSPTIVIECKLDKTIRLGDPAADGITKGRSDTAWSQLVEAKSNRNADVAIMVFSADAVDRTIGAFTDSVRYIDGVGYVVLVDIPRGDFRPLTIAYELARHHALSRRREELDKDVLQALVHKLCSDLSSAAEIKNHLDSAAASCRAASAQVDQALANAEATRRVLKSYLEAGRLESHQLLQLLAPHKTPEA